MVFLVSLALSGVLFESTFIPLAFSGSVRQAARALILGVASTFFVYYAIHCRGLLHRLFNWTPLRYWGNMSYSYYLVHGLMLHAFVELVPKTIISTMLYWVLLPFALAFSIVGAAMLYLAVERPLSFRAPTQRAVSRAAA